MYIGLHVKYRYSCQILIKLGLFSADYRKILKYQISLKSVQWEPSCFMRTNGQTDMTKLIVTFCNFGNTPKNITNSSATNLL